MNVHTPHPLLPFDYIAGNAAHRDPDYRYILDYFAGGGGASTGIEMALGRSPDFAINHDPEALALHEANHPSTTHLRTSVFKANPFNLIGPQGKVGLAWFSPDCKHFSKAKGGKPVEKEIRDLAWVVVKTVRDCEPNCRPEVIILENVEEFKDWGPLTPDNKPDKMRKGEEFRKWTKALRRCGYELEWRELRACDYGAPTIRKRFFLIGRCDGKPIVWPEPTHGRPDDPDVVAGRKLPWRTAATDVIDWSKRGYSIFLSKEDARKLREETGVRVNRPLEPATLKRVAKGVHRFVLTSANPFLVLINHEGDGFRGQSLSDPMCTLTARRDAHGVVAPTLARVAHGEQDKNGKRRGKGEHSAEEPLPTVMASPEFSLVQTHLMTMRNAEKPHTDSSEPTHTITAGGAGIAAVAAHVTKFNTGATGFDPRERVPTLTCAHSDYHPGGALPFGVVEADLHAVFVAQNNNHNGTEGHAGRPADEPLSTVLGKGSHAAVASAGLINMRGSDRRMAGTDKPANTITGQGTHLGAIGATLIKYYGTDQKPDLRGPLATATTKDRFGLAEVETASLDLTEDQRYAAWWVARFMEDYGPADPAPLFPAVPRPRAAMLGVGPYVVVDITLRMLSPRELYNAQGFPPDYRIEIDYNGEPLSKASQTRMCGNSVPPPLARALVAANCPQLVVQREAA